MKATIQNAKNSSLEGTHFENLHQAIHFLTPYFEPRKAKISLERRLEKLFTENSVDPDSIRFNKLISVNTNKGVFQITGIIADGEKNRIHDRNLIKKI